MYISNFCSIYDITSMFIILSKLFTSFFLIHIKDNYKINFYMYIIKTIVQFL